MGFRLECRRRHDARLIGFSRLSKSRITASMSSVPPSTGMFRIDWPRSAADGDNSRPAKTA